jgi:hypothetical protein
MLSFLSAAGLRRANNGVSTTGQSPWAKGPRGGREMVRIVVRERRGEYNFPRPIRSGAGVTGRGRLILVEIKLDLGTVRIVKEQLPDAAAGQAP